ncbi:MAG TPA: hypothetical protein PKW80_06670 [Bacteroidales bacterium]|mgnify:CR=1 FL=1|nr:hypothetical protein [Bacteroidales bacterium]
MKKRFIKFIIWVVSITLFLVLTAIVISKYNRNRCRGVEITIHAPDDGAFLTKADVMTYINESGDSLENNELSKINIEKLEEIISKKPYIQSSKVYMSISGILKIDIVQRTPIARIQPDMRIAGIDGINYSPYYISDDGKLMPLTPGKTARMIFVNGYIRNLYNDFVRLDVDSATAARDTTGLFTTLYNIYDVARFIHRDDFLRAQIQQIYVDENGDLMLIPEVGNHIVIFGDRNNIGDKFGKLKLFYEKAAFIKGWDKYDTINIKYKNQIICS